MTAHTMVIATAGSPDYLAARAYCPQCGWVGPVTRFSGKKAAKVLRTSFRMHLAELAGDAGREIDERVAAFRSSLEAVTPLV